MFRILINKSDNQIIEQKPQQQWEDIIVYFESTLGIVLLLFIFHNIGLV
jgi:hypothetical protein